MNPESLTPPEKNTQQSICISFEVFKKSLGVAAMKYSDTEIDNMRRIADAIAEAAFNDWLRARNAHNGAVAQTYEN